MFKVATWNINSLKVRLNHIIEWLNQHEPTVLALQETKLIDANFPIEIFNQLGYYSVFTGQKTYNGVALLSKLPLTEVAIDMPGWLDPQRRLIAATCGDLRLINIYIPNGENVESNKYQYKLAWLAAFINYLKQQLNQFSKLLVMGDFNIAPANVDVYEPELLKEQVLFSQPERQVFEQLLELGLVDVFRLFEQPPNSYSWWDYRAAAFRRNLGLRIDHILASKALVKHCQACHIDKEPRKWERPSDHAPVLAVLNQTLTS